MLDHWSKESEVGQIKKWDTWFSANICPIDFKQRPNCSSHEAWFACLGRDDCVSILQSTSGSFACPISIRNGMAAATEMSVAALAINSLHRSMPVLSKRCWFYRAVHKQAIYTTSKTIQCTYTDKHRISDVRGRSTPDYAVPW